MRGLVLPTVLVVCVGSACRGGDQEPTTPSPTPTGLLNGEPSAAAASVLPWPSAWGDDAALETEISVDADGVRVIRTEASLALDPAATVAQVNALLEAEGAKVVSSVPDAPFLVVRFADPGDLDGLEDKLARFEADPAVTRADRAIPVAEHELPDNVPADPPSSPAIDHIGHHFAVRGPAAWNARGALSAPTSIPPALLVSDRFKDGAPTAGVTFTPADIFRPLTKRDAAGFVDNSQSASHGYRVLSVVLGTFGGADDPTGWITGIYPDALSTAVIDYKFTWSGATIVDRTLEAVARLNTRVVANASHGALVLPAEAEASAATFRAKLRATGLASSFLLTTSAGNDDLPGVLDAPYGSAALVRPLQDAQGELRKPDNLMVIESADVDESSYAAACLARSSNYGGHVAGVGGRVWVLSSPSGAPELDKGTSFAAPQVAGLAAYVWALRPDLTPSELRDLLMSTARPWIEDRTSASATCKEPMAEPMQPAPLIDAYAAVLATDRPEARTVRRAILDVDGNGLVDIEDVRAFAEAFERADGALDYGRYDLNGDGRTGGSAGAPVDLDVTDGPRQLEQLEVVIEGQPLTFDEADVSDLEALCYWAYDEALFDGDEVARRDLLGPLCACPPFVLTGEEAAVTLSEDALVSALAGVTGIRSLTLRGAGLTSLRGLECLERVDYLTIEGTGLVSLDGLNGLREVGRVRIIDNPALQEVDALRGVVAVTGNGDNSSLRVTDNPRLGSLAGFDQLRRIDGSLAVFENVALVSVGLPALTSVGKAVEIRLGPNTSPSMTQYTLPALEQAGGIRIIGPADGRTVSMPNLHTVARGVGDGIDDTGLTIEDFDGRVRMPALRRVYPILRLTNIKGLDADLGQAVIAGAGVSMFQNSTTGDVVVRGIASVVGHVGISSSSFGADLDLPVDYMESLYIEHNVDLPLSAFSSALRVILHVEIKHNVGFSDDDANAFVNRIQVDGSVSISDNTR